MSKFQRDVKFAEVGEQAVWNYLSKNKSVCQVVDVRQDDKFRAYDVDFLVQMCNKAFNWVEVKTDRKIADTGNLIYEMSTNGNIGCLEKTEADWIAYYDYQNARGYLLRAKGLRTLAHSGYYDLIPMGDRAAGYKIPLADVLKDDCYITTWEDYKR